MELGRGRQVEKMGGGRHGNRKLYKQIAGKHSISGKYPFDLSQRVQHKLDPVEMKGDETNPDNKTLASSSLKSDGAAAGRVFMNEGSVWEVS